MKNVNQFTDMHGGRQIGDAYVTAAPERGSENLLAIHCDASRVLASKSAIGECLESVAVSTDRRNTLS